MFGLAAVTFVALCLMVAPYGRHARRGWGPTMGNRVGWVVMESPSVFLFGVLYASGEHRAELVPGVLCLLWLSHYAHRDLIYPFTLPAGGKPMPVVIVASGVAFNVLNCVVNAGWIGQIGRYDAAWLYDPRFIAGVLLFIGGRAINLQADRVLRRLRGPGEQGYKVPRDGLYDWISCPNYLGEILEWTGWAVATWSISGLAFAVYTVANLAPRAVSHHRWYRKTFPDYPPSRKALIPGLV
jgi:protein-S-isoprenylcysteine O-methyltransferase Ste14